MSAVEEETEDAPASQEMDDDDDDGIEPAVTWEDPGVYLLSAETVQEIASRYLCPDNKQTRLNNSASLWSALESLKLKIPGYKIKGNRFKIPGHVVAQQSWDAALTNALTYAMMTNEEQEIERRRFRKASDSEKMRWRRLIERLHKRQNRKTSQELDRKEYGELHKTPFLSKKEIAELRAAVHDPKKLEDYIAHGSDPERVNKIRQLVEKQLEKQAIEEKRKKKVYNISTTEMVKEKKDEYKRTFGDVPDHCGRQVDSVSRKAAKSALEQAAKYLQTIHYPNNGNPDQALHTLMLVIYNDVEKQNNLKGGRLMKGKKADVYDLTVLAYDEETLYRMINCLNEQFGERDERYPRPPCTKHFIHKMEGKTFIESAHEFLDNTANKQKRRSRKDVSVCVACNTDLTAASYARLKDKSTSIACTHALCMVCFGQAHVNRSISASPRLHCLCETCEHASLAWKIVTYDGTNHTDSVEQMLPNEIEEIAQDDGTRMKRRRTKAEMLEMREQNGYTDKAWRRYHPEDFPDYRPRGETELQPQRRKFGMPPLSVGGQVDSVARKAYSSAIHMIAKFTQTVHFPNNGDNDQPLHSMVLVFYNDVAKQNNALGGRLSNAKRSDYELTVLAYDNQTCAKIMRAVTDQFGYRDIHTPRPSCTKQFMYKLEGMTMMESVHAFMDDFTDKTNSNGNV